MFYLFYVIECFNFSLDGNHQSLACSKILPYIMEPLICGARVGDETGEARWIKLFLRHMTVIATESGMQMSIKSRSDSKPKNILAFSGPWAWKTGLSAGILSPVSLLSSCMGMGRQWLAQMRGTSAIAKFFHFFVMTTQVTADSEQNRFGTSSSNSSGPSLRTNLCSCSRRDPKIFSSHHYIYHWMFCVPGKGWEY